MGGHPQKRHLDSKASCSESRLILIRVADLPLSECALYRQAEQERHFRWRGWMLRPRVIRSPTNPKWERSRVRFPLRAACSFCFLFCCLSFFLSSPVSSPSTYDRKSYMPSKSYMLRTSISSIMSILVHALNLRSSADEKVDFAQSGKCRLSETAWRRWLECNLTRDRFRTP